MTELLIHAPDARQRLLSVSTFLEELEEVAKSQTALPFSERRVEVITSVSSILLKTKILPSFVTHFAFWTRTSAIQRLKRNFFGRLPSNALARPRGLVFHLPPQNVETVFLYSWVLSYLVGNTNVVRLPSAISSEMRSVCDLLVTQLQQHGDSSQYFVHYEADSDVSAEISSRSDARIVWGGDAKVASFSTLPLRNGGKALWFGDRFSWALFNGDSLINLSIGERRALARKFANDVGMFDQMACASPHALYIVGNSAEHVRAAEAFLADVGECMHLMKPQHDAGQDIYKMTEAFAIAACGDGKRISWKRGSLTTVITSGVHRNEMRVGGGFIQVTLLSSVGEFTQIPREHDQTIVHFGFSNADIQKMAQLHVGLGVSRWCPVGSALDFDFIWDGYDIPFELTRLVSVS